MNLKPKSKIEKRIKELEHELEPYEKQYDKAEKDAAEAAAKHHNDKLDYADGRMRYARKRIRDAYAKFGKAIHDAYRHKN